MEYGRYITGKITITLKEKHKYVTISGQTKYNWISQKKYHRLCKVFKILNLCCTFSIKQKTKHDKVNVKIYQSRGDFFKLNVKNIKKYYRQNITDKISQTKYKKYHRQTITKYKKTSTVVMLIV